MLSSDPPIESVVPFTSHGDILTACVQMQVHNYNVQLLDELRRHCVEIAKLLHYSWSNGTLQSYTVYTALDRTCDRSTCEWSGSNLASGYTWHLLPTKWCCILFQSNWRTVKEVTQVQSCENQQNTKL